MNLENIRAEIAILLDRLADHPHDNYELEMMVRGKLDELRAYGMPLPADLVELESVLSDKLAERTGKAPPPPQRPRRS